MPNPYYTNTNDLVPFTKARAADVEANFNAVGLGFDGVDADMQARAQKAGESYSGVHDFSAASQVILPGGTNIDEVSAAELDSLDGITGNIQEQLDLKSPTESPNFSGMPRSPTFAFGTSGNLIATVEYVNQAMFQTVLPSQSGRMDGDVLTTNGLGVADWRTPQKPNGRIYFTGSF